MRELCVAELGEAEGEKLAAMALPGFRLTPARPVKPAAGLSRRGGPALLDPGTPRPQCDGIPLSLFAVLDTEVLAPWLGDVLPHRAGLLNFFYLQPDPADEDAMNLFFDGEQWHDPRAGRVIAALPPRAVEV
ncbi:DUF1963 domain-containing protein [Streptomyces sp. NBC_01508]|uniref:DUF1963 domain-containing protein n=1 Tax=Streptomyces sp. NBC_01508 TaxID=2903888 RepID=UPI00386776FC